MNFVSKFDGSLPFTGTHPKAQTHVETVQTKAPSDAIVVKDANLLFNGDFRRAGTDLVISKDDHELVLSDYFKGDKRAPIASPDGAWLSGKIVDALTGHVQVAQADGSASAAKIIGHVTKLSGNATVVRNGVSIILNNGDNVYQGDVVQSGSNSTVGITFIDGSVFGLASNAKMVLNEMVYDPNGSSNSSLLSLVQGTISFVAGATAKHGDMKVDTPVATMGIRGTAVLVEIDFVVTVPGSAPPARFQVLVEPDGTSGSILLLDRVTLAPLATVNQPGTVTTVSGQGTVSFLASAQLSPELMKLISEVFSLRFTDSSPKSNTHFTDSVVPEITFPVKFAGGETGTATLRIVTVQEGSTGPSGTPPATKDHIPGSPGIVTFNKELAERTALTGSSLVDTTSGGVSYSDPNLGDVPTVSTTFLGFGYKNATGQDVKDTLTATQLSAIAAVSVPLVVVQDANGKNNGTATWTYNVEDHSLDFLAAGEMLTLTYVARVDNNFAQNNEISFASFTITITGTNDVPTIVVNLTTASDGVVEDAALNGAGNIVADGTLIFNDVDLTDTHTASFVLKSTDASANLPGFAEGAGAGVANIGTFALNAVGEVPADADTKGSVGWTFTLNNNSTVLQSLAVGQTITQVYTVTIIDNNGAAVTQDVTVTIAGTNDDPVIISSAGDASGAVTEDTNPTTLTTGGTLSIRDLDLIDTHGATAVFLTSSSNAHLPGFSEGTTNIGSFAIDPSVTESNGDTDNTATLGWTFTLADDDPMLQSLAAGQIITQVYRVTFTDNNGATVTQDVTVTITGSNDSPNHAPTIIGELTTATGAVTEDAATPTLSTGGIITFRDVDLIDTHTAGFVLKSTDATADLPGFAEDNSALADNIGTFALTPATVVGGTVVEFADTNNTATVGWTFTLNNNSSVLQSLAAGQTITQVYTVTITDNNLLPVTQDVTVTITGTNDAPEIVGALTTDSGEVTEDAATPTLTTGGTITFQDVDLIDTHTAGFVLKSTDASADLPGFAEGISALADNIGTFAIDLSVTESAIDTDNQATLGWTFTLNNNSPVLQSLAAGQTITQVYTVTITDNNGLPVTHDVTVTINGTNDAPEIVGALTTDTGEVTEDAATPTLTSGGTITLRDVDLIDTHTAGFVLKSTDASADLPGFAEGISALADNIGTFAIDLSVTESAIDTDNQATLGWTFTLNNNSPVLQSLAAGQTITQVYTVTITDNNLLPVTRDVTVTITGTNDAPEIVGALTTDTGEVTEDAATPTLTTGGTIAFQDVDLIDTHTASPTQLSSSSSVPLAGFTNDSTYLGTFTLDPVSEDGSDTNAAGSVDWTFTLDNSNPILQSLPVNQAITQVYRVTLPDGIYQDVTVTINGTNDAPVLTAAAPTLATISEDDTVTNTGQTVASFLGSSIGDVDTGAVQGIAITATTSQHGHWEYSTDGSTFTNFPAVSTGAALLLAATDKIKFVPDGTNGGTDTLTYVAWDQATGTHGTTAAVTVSGGSSAFSLTSDTATLTVTDVNDAPVLTPAAPTLATISEDETVTNTGQTVFSFLGSSIGDVDTGAVQGIAITATTSQHGHWEYSTDGSTFTNFPAVSTGAALLLAATDKIKFVPDGTNGGTDTLTYVAWDRTTGTHGTTANVSATGGTTAYSLTSDIATLQVTDVNDEPTGGADNLDTIGLQNSGYTFNSANGHWYRVDQGALTYAQAQALAESSGGYLATITDGQENAFVHSLVQGIPANGAIADPYAQRGAWLGGADAAVEGTWVWQAGPEAGQAFWQSPGTTFIYASWNPIEPNNVGNEDYVFMGNNGNWFDYPGGSAVAGYVVETEVGRPGDGSFTDEDTAQTIATATLLANDDDVDEGAVLAVTNVSATSALGATVTLNGTTISYDPGNAPQLQALAAGQSATDTFTYTVSDGLGGTSTATATLTVSGVNDAPVINSNGGGTTASVSVAENTTAVTTVQAADVDNATVTYSLVTGAGSPDKLKFAIDSNTGALSFATAPDFEAPGSAAGSNVYTVQVQASDGAGGTDLQTISVTVTNVAENPTYLVTSTADTTDAGTLRSAIAYANSHPNTVITFSNSIANSTITLTNELPLITGNGTVIDGGSNNVTISGNDQFRPFFIGDTTSTVHVTIENLTIAHGAALGGAGGSGGGGGGGGLGGAIFVSHNASLNLINASVQNNSAVGGAGGAAGPASFYGAGGGGGGMGGAGAAGGTGPGEAGGGGGGFGIGANGGVQNIYGGGTGAAGDFTGGAAAGAGIGFTATGYGPGGPGGANGGGGGGSGYAGAGGGGGVGGGSASLSPNQGGSGGFGGGGGGGGPNSDAHGGNGGYGGGGGGGGDAGGMDGSASGIPGTGGFAGGGGGYGHAYGAGPSVPVSGGFAGGSGGASTGNVGGYTQNQSGGGGGAGMGGGIFVMDGGSLTIAGTLSINGDTVAGGAGGGGGAGNGGAFGGGIFLAGSSGTITFAPGAGQTATISDAIADQSGSGGTGGNAGVYALVLDGAGKLVLSGTNTYTGATTIVEGTLQVDGSIANSAVTVQDGGTLGGNGATGAVTLEAGATLAPGASAGLLNTGNLSFEVGATFAVELGGASAGVGGYDQIHVSGTVYLNGATLSTSLVNAFDPASGTFTIIDNDGTSDAVSGTFAGLTEGAVFTAGGHDFRISYAGGDGNDVTLSVVDDEFRVNTTTANAQQYSAVGALTGGGFVIAWVSTGQDGSGTGIYAQRYDSSGAPVGGEFLVNTVTTDNQSGPFVEGLADGGYVVSWSSGSNNGATIHAQRYNSSGATVGGELNVGTYGENSSIAALTNGGYVITYTTGDANLSGTYAVIYGANVNDPPSGPFLVNTTTAGQQQPASVVGTSNGGFIVSWHSSAQDNVDGSWGVYFQRFDASGAKLGGEVRANVTTAGDQYGGKLAVLTDGSFVVTWQDQSAGTIVARHFNASGQAISGEVTIGIGTDDTVQALPDGGYFVTYKASDGSNVGLFGQCVSASDTLNGAAFQINQTTTGEQNFLSDRSNPTAVLASGAIVSTWFGEPNVGGNEIYARLFTVLQASADTVTTNENAPITLSNLTANDTTVGSSAPKIVSVYDAQHGTVDLNGGVPVFTPDAGFAGQASFSYWISETANPTPPGTFNAAVNYASGTYPQAVTIADINGDGKLDLLTSDYTVNVIGVLLGNGNGTFQNYGTLSAGDRPATPVVVADFDNDGAVDIAVGNFGSDDITIWYGNGNGTYSTSSSYSAGDGPEGLSAADVNGDGNIDLVVSDYNSGKISVTLGNGNRTFQAPVEYSVGGSAGSLPYLNALADLNGDGKLDIVVGNAGSSNISVLLGTGTGTFNAAVNYATPAGSNAVAIGDLNGDGILDIVSSNGTVSVFLGNGDGTFQPQTSYAAGVRTKGIALADLNQDGLLDVVVGNSRDGNVGAATNSVSVLFGNGDGTLDGPVAYATAWDTYGVAVADLNGDGRPDIAAPNELSDNVSVLLNATPGGALSSATVTVNVVADAPPTVSGDMAITLVKGSGVALTTADLNATDLVSGPVNLTFTVVETSRGHLVDSLSANTIAPGGHFMLADVIAGHVLFVADNATYAGAGGIALTLSDGVTRATPDQAVFVGVSIVDAEFRVLTAGGYDFDQVDPIDGMGSGTVVPVDDHSFRIVNTATNRDFIFTGNGLVYNPEAHSFSPGGTIVSILEVTHDTQTELALFSLNVPADQWYAAVVARAAGDNSQIEALVSQWSFNFIGNAGGDFFGAAEVNDVFTGNGGNDGFDGAFGFDRAAYTHATGPIDVQLADGTVKEYSPDVVPVLLSTDTLQSIELVTGSNFADIFNAGATASNPGNPNSFPVIPPGFSAFSTNAGSRVAFNVNGTFNEFEGRGGDDTITGNGDTRISYSHATSGVTVTFNGWVPGQGASGQAVGDASVGTDTFSGVSRVRGSFFDDAFYGSTNSAGTGENFEGLGGNDIIHGGGGFDRAIYGGAFMGAGIVVNLAAGTVTGASDVGTDTLNSVEGISGTDFADVYNAVGFTRSDASNPSINSGSTQISASNPNPSDFNEFEGRGGDDVITGNGNTRIAFYSATGGVVVTLGDNAAVHGSAVGASSGVDDIVSGVSHVNGSEFNDIITGNDTGAGNTLDGRAGNDVLDGRGGNDRLTGGTGADIFVYGSAGGNDRINDFNRSQGDRIDLRTAGVAGTSTLVFTEGTFNPLTGVFTAGVGGPDTRITDTTHFGSSSSHSILLVGVSAGSLTASDFIFTGQVAVSVQTLDGYDFSTLYDSLAAGVVDTQASTSDRIYVVDTARGVTYELIGTGIFAGGSPAGATVTAINILDTTDPTKNTQDHVLVNTNGWGFTANDLFDAIAQFQADNSQTTDLDDLFNPASYSAVGSAGYADFHSQPRSGADVFFGGDQADVFNGLPGPFGAFDPGSDTVDYSHATSAVSVNLQTGAKSGTAALGDTFISIENLRGTAFSDTLTGDGQANVIEGGLGDDLLDGGGNGFNGGDTVSYEHATSAVSVDLNIVGVSQDTVGAGLDTLTGFEGVRGSAWDDTLTGSGNSVLEGGAGNDTLIGQAVGSDTASYQHAAAGVTVDLVEGIAQGGAGNDILTNIRNVWGSEFNDVITGNSAENSFFGQSGNDTFVFSETGIGHDTIGDFQSGEDHIQIDYTLDAPFDPNDAASFNTWLAGHVTTNGGDLLIDLDSNGVNQNTILLQNASIAGLRASDFILHPGGGFN